MSLRTAKLQLDLAHEYVVAAKRAHASGNHTEARNLGGDAGAALDGACAAYNREAEVKADANDTREGEA